MGNTVTHIRGLHLFPSSSFKSTQQKKQQRNSLKGERGGGKKNRFDEVDRACCLHTQRPKGFGSAERKRVDGIDWVNQIKHVGNQAPRIYLSLFFTSIYIYRSTGSSGIHHIFINIKSDIDLADVCCSGGNLS